MPMLANGYNAQTIEVFKTNENITAVMLASDNTYFHAPAPKLRVAFHDNNTDHWHVQHITLPDSDKAYADSPVTGNNIVTIVREGNDAGDNVPVAYRLY